MFWTGCWLDRSFWISLLHWLCVQVFADPPCGTASGSYRPQCAAPYPPLIYPPRLNLYQLISFPSSP